MKSHLYFKRNLNYRTGNFLLILFLFIALFASNINAQITVVSGGVSLNPSYPSFTTATGLFAALNANAQTGQAIVIRIDGDVTTEDGAIALGAGTWTSISINPNGARTISGTVSTKPMIDFNGSDNVTIDGLNASGNSLTISNLSNSATSTVSTIRFIGGATSNTITNCSVLGSFSGTVATNGGNIFFSTDALTANGNDNNTISNCNLGPASASLPTKCIYGNGSLTTTAIGNSGNIINNNNIFDYFGAAVTSAGIATGGGCNAWSITNNRFYQTGTRTWTTGAIHNAINIQNTTATSGAQGFTITGNIIGYASNTQTGTYTLTGSTGKFNGITFNGITGGTISNINSNTFASISMTGVTSSGTSSSSPFMPVFINNGLVNNNSNTIGSQTATGSLVFTTTTTTATDVYGMLNFGNDAWTTNNNLIGGISVTNLAASGTFIIYCMRGFTVVGQSWTSNLNFIGGTIANSIQLTATGVSSQVIGLGGTTQPSLFTGNTIRNLTTNIGTGTTTAASVIGITTTATGANHTLSQNTIFNLTNTNATAASVVTGIQFNGSTVNLVERNSIYGLTVASNSASAEVNGIRVAGGTTTFRNNMIAIGAGISNAVLVNGIIEVAGTDNYFHNSVYIGGSPIAGSANSFAFNSTVTTNTRSFRDNIFVNARNNSGATGKNYVVQVGGTAANPAGLTINNNIYQVSGSGGVFGRFNALDVANLTPAWKTAVGQDASSFESNPQYNDPTNATPDLHINPSISTPAEGNGADLGVLNDFDGQTRAGLTPVDIGADAGNFTGLDLLAPTITYTALGNTASLANRSFTNVSVTDVSGVNGTSGTRPRVYYKKSTDANDLTGWKQVEANGSVSAFDFTIDYTLLNAGSVSVGDIIQYFVVAQDLATTPNVAINSGNFAAFPTSVALTNTAFPIGGTINSYTIVPSISGTLVVPSLTYPSLTLSGGAFAAINSAAVVGNITIEIAGDLAGETGAIQLNEFASPYTVTIKPTGGARNIAGTSVGATALITLNAADRVIIDGSLAGTSNTICPASTASRDLTITNTNSNSSSAVIWLQSNGVNGSTDNTIKNCNIVGNSGTTTLIGVGSGSSTISITSAGTGNNNNSYINNNLSKSQIGIYSGGASSANKNTGTVINQNLINTASPNNVGKGGILVHFDNGTLISANNISGISVSGDAFGISLGETSWVATTATGNEVTNATITKNIIGQVVGSGTNSAAGIIVGPAASGTILIANNMIYGVISNATPGDIASGIFVIGATGGTTQIYYNTVYMSGDRGAGTTANSFALAIFGTTPVVDVRNNILLNTQTTSSTGKSYAIGLGYSSTVGNYANLTSDHNDFFTSGANAAFACTGTLNSGTDRTSLGAWTTETGRDGGGFTFTFLPVFTSATDLHIVANDPINLPLYNGAATVSVTDDIDCNSRATDIGADEFFPPACSAVVAGSVNSTNNGPFCGSGSSTLSFSGVNSGVGLSYQWQSSPDNTFASPTNLGTAATQVVNPGVGTTFYRAIVNCATDASTSTTTPDYSLTVYAIPTATVTPAGPLNICSPATQLLTANTSASNPTYVWSKNGTAIPAETNPTYLASTSGSYTVTISENGCSSTSTPVVITVNPEVIATASGPANPICLGQETTLSATATAGINGMPSFNITAASGPISLAVPDNSLTGVTQSVSISGSGSAVIDAGSIISVTVSATTTFNGDLDFYLVGPGNCGTLELSTDNGSSGDNYAGAILVTPSGATNINTLSGATNNISGTWKAEGSYNTAPGLASGTSSGSYTLPAVSIAGCPVDGSWTLFVGDDANDDLGTLTQFDLNISNTVIGNFTHAFSGGSGTFSATSYSGSNNTTGTATITPTIGGVNNYTVITTAPSGCTKSNIVSVTVNDPNDGNPCTVDACNTTNGVVTNTQPIHNVTTGFDYCTLQAALNDPATTNGDVIQLRVPNHSEGLVTISKSVTINGLFNTFTSTSATYGLDVEAPGVIIHNITVKNAGTFGIQVGCGSDNLTLTNVTVDDCGGTGIGLNGSDNASINNLTSTNNGGNGISITNCNNTVINGITTSGNSFGGGFNAGIGLFTSSVYCLPAGINGFTLTGVISIAELTKVYSQKDNASHVITGLIGSSIQWAVGIAALDRSYWPDKPTAYAVVDALFEAPYNYPNSVIYVAEISTENYYVNDDPNGDATPPMLIQAAVTYQAPNQTIYVESGTYNEDVNVNKTLRILGTNANTTSVFGVFGGDGATFRINANNVEIAGFTITRLGNNTTDWNNPALNTAGIAIQGTSISGTLIRDNIITGNRTGIDINNSSTHTIRNNDITFNRTGLIFRNQTDNLTILENNINDNWTVGVLFLDGSGGTNSPVQTALNSNVHNNNISGNWYGQIQDRQSGGSLPAPGTNQKNFTCNWYGAVPPVKVTTNSTEPGYATQIPVAYGGLATPPGGQPDIGGTASANFVYAPFLLSGTDTNVETTPGQGTNGFQPAAGCAAPCALVLTTSTTVAGCPAYNDGTATVNISSGGVGPYTYLWSTGATTATITGLTAGTYNVTVTDINGCTASTSATVTNTLTGPVHNINTGLDYCTIQAAVNAAPTLDGHTLTVDPGTYNEQVIVNKSLTIKASGIVKPDVNYTGVVSGKPTLFDVTANNVSIENIHFNVDLSKLRSAIIASSVGLDNISIIDNTIDAYGAPAGSFGDRNAVSVNYTGTTNYRVAAGGVNNITFTGNIINGTLPASFFRSGISTDESGGTYTGNTIQTINHDILVRFGSNGAITISNNNFNGGGVELAEQNAGAGVVTVSSNIFTGAGAPGTAVLRIKNNYNSKTHNITGNTFNSYDWGVSLENANSVTLDGNTFATGLATAHAIVVNTKSISSNSSLIVQVPVAATITNNNFNGTGNALTFQNHDSDNDSYGTFTIGGVGSENNFASTLSSFIVLDAQSGSSNGSVFPVYPTTGTWPTTMAFWATNLDGRNNKYDVGSGLQLPSAMSLTNLFAVEDRIQHSIDASGLGFVTIKSNHDYVTVNSFVTPVTTAARIQRGVDASSNGWTVNVGPGSFIDAVTVNKQVNIAGQGQGITNVYPSTSNPNCGGAGGGSLCAGSSNVFLVQENNVVIHDLTIDGDNTSLTSGTVVGGADLDARNGIITNHTLGVYQNLEVYNVTIQNIYLRGIYASSGGSFNFHNNVIANVQANPGSIGMFNFGGSGFFTNNNVTDCNDGISSNWSTGTVYSGNTVSSSGSGIHSDNNGGLGGVADVIDNNLVQNSDVFGYGIWVFAPYRNVQVSHNTVKNVDVGMACAGQNAPVTPVFFENEIDGQNKANSTGMYVTTNLFGFGSANVSVDFNNNYVKNNTGDGFFLESEAGQSLTLQAHNNSITGNTPFNLENGTGLSGAGTFNVDATCNWWGTNSAPAVAASISGTITYIPYLADGTDNSGAIGFQPLAVCAPCALTASATSTDANCPLYNDGTATANVTGGGTGPYTYSWSNGATTATATGLTSGLYTVTITDVTGCTASASVTVNNSLAGPVHNINTGLNYCTIQAAVNAAPTLNGHTITVDPGNYDEDVNVFKSLSILGAGAGSTSIRGVIGGDGATVRITANNVVIAGFTITRIGNNTTDWNNPGLNSAGIAIQGTSITGALIRDNVITGNRTGIDINNSSSHTIRNNDITFNRTGLIFRNQTDNLTIVENNINDNWTVGVLFLDASGGTNSPVQTALNSNVHNNNISGNWYGQIQDRQSGGSLPAPGANQKNFTCNWYGTTSPVKVNTNSTEPGYAAQIPVAYGGLATPPGGQPEIGGTASANFIYIPYLITGTDTNIETTPGQGTNGFQPVAGCSAPCNLALTSSSTEATCPSFNNGTATVNVTGGSGNYSYSWSSGATTSTASGLTAGNYTVLVTDLNGCTSTTSVSVGTTYALPVVPPDGSSTVQCAQTPTPPNVNDVCGNPITPSAPVTSGNYAGCEGTLIYTYTYTDIFGGSVNWKYTYTVDHTTPPVVPANGSATVQSKLEAVPPPTPIVTDVCGAPINPVLVSVVESPNPLVCEGTRTYNYTYTDCSGLSSSWSFTYTVNIDDQDACTIDACNTATGVITHTQVNRNDGNACTFDGCDPVNGVFHLPFNINDGNACTDDACNTLTGQITHNPINTFDGNACTVDGCNTITGEIHTPVHTDDGNACTIDGCDPVNGVFHSPINTDDNNACTADGCNSLTGVFHNPVTTDDNNACTIDGCESIGGVYHNPVSTDDGNACTIDGCNTSTGVTHTPVNTDDGNACTTDGCNTSTGVFHTPLPVDDGNACTFDGCDAVNGVFNIPVNTDDNNACTVDGCNTSSGVFHNPVNVDDNNLCTTDGCETVGGVYHTPVPTDDGNPCTIDGCNSLTGVSHVSVNTDDGNACTTDACNTATGAITHVQANTNDGNACTIDACNPSTGIITHTAVNTDDGNACTTDACNTSTGAITHIPVTTDDGNACTTDACNPSTGAITHTAVNTDDGNACTTDVCNTSTGAITHVPLVTDDGNACTTDACNPTTGAITHTAVNTDDGNACTTDACNTSTGAVTHVPVTTDDGNACTTDACNPSTGAITHVTINTDDGNACTTDGCNTLTGEFHNAVLVNDGNACTFDGCDPVTGIFHQSVNTDDNNACTADGCNTASGVFHNPINIDDNNLCTTDGCESIGGVFHNPVATNDGNFCTIDGCDAMTGVYHIAVNSDDGNACTTDACDSGTGAITHVPVAIDDNNACTADACDIFSGTVFHTPVNTDDGSVCTIDGCDTNTGVYHNPVNTNDGNSCTTDGCDPVNGPYHITVDINDNNACTTDACNTSTGSITHTAINTDDGNVCTTDGCNSVTGVFHTPVSTDDGNACTSDGCDVISGVYHNPVNTDDGNPCTADACNTSTGVVTHTNDSPVVNATAGTIACYGGTTCVTVSASGGQSPYFGTGVFCGYGMGSYTFDVIDSRGCIATSPVVNINEPTKLVATGSSTPASCSSNDGTATVSVSGGTPSYTYLWSPGGQTTNPATGLAAGNYSCSVTDANGCNTTANVVVGSASGSSGAPAAISGASGVCKKTNVVYCVDPVVPGATSYSWTLPAGATVVGSATGPCITVKFSTKFKGGFICAKSVNPCGSSLSSTVGSEAWNSRDLKSRPH